MNDDLEEWLKAEMARVAKAREEAAETAARFLHNRGFERAPLSKYDGFLMALRAVCRMHGVRLYTSDYGYLVVGDLRDGDDPICHDHIKEGP
jgi:hypothetical protein